MRGADKATVRILKIFDIKESISPKLLSSEDVSFFYAEMSSYLHRFQYFQQQKNLPKCSEIHVEMSLMLGIQCYKMGLQSIYHDLCEKIVTELNRENAGVDVGKVLLKHASGELMTNNGEPEYVYSSVDELLIQFFEKLNYQEPIKRGRTKRKIL